MASAGFETKGIKAMLDKKRFHVSYAHKTTGAISISDTFVLAASFDLRRTKKVEELTM